MRGAVVGMDGDPRAFGKARGQKPIGTTSGRPFGRMFLTIAPGCRGGRRWHAPAGGAYPQRGADGAASGQVVTDAEDIELGADNRTAASVIPEGKGVARQAGEDVLQVKSQSPSGGMRVLLLHISRAVPRLRETDRSTSVRPVGSWLGDYRLGRSVGLDHHIPGRSGAAIMNPARPGISRARGGGDGGIGSTG